jgi:hypothetical protein
VRAAQIAVICCLAVDVTLLAQLGTIAVAAPESHPPALMAAAAAASLVRLPYVGRAAAQCHSSARLLG